MKKLKIKTNFEMESFIINLDRPKFFQVFLSLILNATKHTNSGFIEIKVKGLEMINKLIEITVSDSGCGIDPEKIDKIFDIFSSGTPTNELNPQGIGLQLFVSKNLVKKIKGKIKVKSTRGKGTSFNIYFPKNLNEYNSIDSPNNNENYEEIEN